ncbi:MAG: sulfatase-like hydrolase/transferase [Salinivirgaceae bacterium]|nr:sulfatase-like hydrolase/transferase [Salinivirgaceae bacterium]
MTLTRVVFYIMNFHLFSSLNFSEVLLHFMYGMRFDLATIALANIFYVLFSSLPAVVLSRPWYQLFLKYLFIVPNIILLAINMVDCKFYEFEGKRLTADFFNKEWLGNDFVTLLPEFIKDYWYAVLLFAVLTFLFIYLYPKYSQNKFQNSPSKLYNIAVQSLLGVIIIGLTIVLSRGGFQLKPVSIITAARYAAPENIALVLNSPFTIIKTFGRQSLPNPKYFTEEGLPKTFNPEQHYGDSLPMNKKNVVLIILESFGKEYSGFLNEKRTTYTPKFDSIMQLGLTCTQGYSNGKRSIEALPSIMSGIPSLMDNAFITSSYTSIHIESIGSLLKKQGYYTAFYHGGKNGTMGFDNFIKLSGIENYFGLDEYPNPADNDGNWGIFDEPYLTYFCNEISQMQEPFFASVFTLSSHHPYQLPLSHQGKYPKGNLVNLESIGYADFSLGKFFQLAAKQPWFSNTLFVLCADHTAQADEEFYKSTMGKFAIPIVFYAPTDTALVGINNTTCQQADIFPSILDYLNYPGPFITFGHSIFDTNAPRGAVSYSNGLYQLIHDDWVINFNGKHLVSVEQFVDGKLINIDVTAQLPEKVAQTEELLKAIIQQFNIRLEKNQMTVGKPATTKTK